jgi:septal ring factor EnvC (AmiA/AmiB activator)
LDKEIRMDANHQDDREFSSPPWAQRWFLKRSRDGWKKKYMGVKAEVKRQSNRVNDVTKSRDKWREQYEQAQKQLKTLRAENDALQQQLAGLKKTGVADA